MTLQRLNYEQYEPFDFEVRVLFPELTKSVYVCGRRCVYGHAVLYLYVKPVH